MLAIGMSGTSSALWGFIVAMKYKKVTAREILIDFINIKQSYSSYLYVVAFVLLDFCYVLIGGRFLISVWYTPIILFLKAVIFGGIEEIGWRYTFQPALEEKRNYILSTIVTFVCWGIWHMLYFYIEGNLHQVHIIEFLIGLLVNCFILSALYRKTKSLWICVMAHSLINMFSQISSGGNPYVSFLCRGIIITVAIIVSARVKNEWDCNKPF